MKVSRGKGRGLVESKWPGTLKVIPRAGVEGSKRLATTVGVRMLAPSLLVRRT